MADRTASAPTPAAGRRRARTSDVTASLVAHLRDRKAPTLVLTELALDGDWGDAGRLDVVALTFGARRATTIEGFEVKVSRSDFTKDVDTLKWQKYLRSVDRMTYAVPAGLVRKDEVPPGVGLMTVGEGGRWQTIVRPDFRDHQRTETGQLVRILRRCHDDLGRLRQQADDPGVELAMARRLARMFHHARDLAAFEELGAYWLDDAVKARVRALARAEATITERTKAAERQAARIVADAERTAAALTDVAATAALLREVVNLTWTALSGSGRYSVALTAEDLAPVLDALSAAKQRATQRTQALTDT